MHRRIPALVVLLAAVVVALTSGTASAATYTCPTQSVSTPFLNGGVQVNTYNLQCNGDDTYAYGSLRYETGGEWQFAFSSGGSLPACVYWPGGGTHCNRGAGGYAADGSHHIWGPHTYSGLTEVNGGPSLAPYCAHNWKVIFSAFAKTTLVTPKGYDVDSGILSKTC